jgi:hypothetical protein
MNDAKNTIVFTPDNEPYLGRELLFHFDNAICTCLEQNAKTAPTTHGLRKTDLQEAACQLIPQSISIALSIRELIRQGYLFGAQVLLRPFVERATILLYLNECPSEIEKWKHGWQYNEAPTLARMFEFLAKHWAFPEDFKGGDLTAVFNSVTHGKPDCGIWSLTPLSNGNFGHTPSKQINRSQICDDICANAIPWLVCVQAMMSAYFPEALRDE